MTDVDDAGVLLPVAPAEGVPPDAPLLQAAARTPAATRGSPILVKRERTRVAIDIVVLT
jgi:hypothetical protein